MRGILDDYDKKVAQLMKSREVKPAGTTYSGAKKCAECHKPFYTIWRDTEHARAFATLESSGKASDPECIICHSVGFNQEGGFFSMEQTPELANVQCESCHGLNRGHLDDYESRFPQVTEKVCLTCHTREHSPDFDFHSYSQKVRHW